MASVVPKLYGKNGLVQTFEALTAVTGGQLVIPQTGATSDASLQGIQPAGAGALNVLGVATSDGVPTSATAGYTTGTSAYDAAYPVIDTSVPDSAVSVETNVLVNVTYTAVAVAYGVRLKAAAAGAVAAFVHGTDDPAMVVGWCAQIGGVSSAGGVALARILV